MSRPIPPDKRSSLVAGFVLNSLDELEVAEFGQLAASDPTVLQEVDQLQQSLEASLGFEEVAPPAGMRDRLLSSVSSPLAESTPASDISPVNRKPNIRYNRLLKAATAALAAALALSNYFWWQSRQQVAQTLEEPAVGVDSSALPKPQLVYELAVAEAGRSGSATLSVDPNTLTATLDASDLPLIGAEKTYVLWTVLTPDAPYTTDDKSAILMTTFTVDERGRRQTTLSVPPVFEQLESVEAIAVTVESAEEPQAHENAPVLITR